ncbi:MAG: hypothetical protein R3C59_03935 [Planctomycetaceae bacterium]
MMVETARNSPAPSVNDLVMQWMSETGDSLKLNDTRELLALLDQELYADYQPFPESAPFIERLAEWLHNVRDDKTSQQLLFNFVPWLLFIGRKEMETMYRAAFTGPITRWIIEDAQLDIADPSLPQQFSDAVRETYFGSLAGMDVGGFFRVNGLAGQSDRPDFRALSRFGDFDTFKDEILCDGFCRVVAIEDMVGKGTQMLEASPVLMHLEPMSVLVCPIVAAPAGVQTWLTKLKKPQTNLAFSPLFVIPEDAAVSETVPPVAEPQTIEEIRELIRDSWPSVCGRNPSPQLQDGPFGYGRFGSLVLSYLNCPDNVPPFIHYQSESWSPLFRRVSREG